MACIGGGFGASSGINPLSGLGNIPTSQVTVYDGVTLPNSGGTGDLNSVLLALDAAAGGANGIFTPANSGLTVSAGFLVNLTDTITFSNANSAAKVAAFNGDIKVTGIVDPTGVVFDAFGKFTDIPSADVYFTGRGVSFSDTIWINPVDGHIYREGIDLELGALSSTTTYDGAANLSSCTFAVSGDLNSVISTLADEICNNNTSIAALVTGSPAASTRNRSFRVAANDTDIVEDNFLTNTGTGVGIGVGHSGTHDAALKFGTGNLLAQYSPDRDLDTADVNTLIDKAFLSSFFTTNIGLLPLSLWDDGVTNTDTTYLIDDTKSVVIGLGDVSTTSKLFVYDDADAETLLTVSNPTVGNSASSILEAKGNTNETARLGFYSVNNNITEWQDKAVLSAGTATAGLLLNSQSDIILQSGGNTSTQSIVNVSSDGVSIGLLGAATTDALEVSGLVRLRDLGGASVEANGNVLTINSTGEAEWIPSVGGNIYTQDGVIDGVPTGFVRTVDGLDVSDGTTKNTLHFTNIDLFDVDAENIEMSSVNDHSLIYGGDLAISNGADNSNKVLKNTGGTDGVVEWVDYKIESLVDIPTRPAPANNYLLKLNNGGNFEWVTQTSVGGNIYNINGSLTSDRTVDGLDNWGLLLNQLTNFDVVTEDYDLTANNDGIVKAINVLTLESATTNVVGTTSINLNSPDVFIVQTPDDDITVDPLLLTRDVGTGKIKKVLSSTLGSGSVNKLVDETITTTVSETIVIDTTSLGTSDVIVQVRNTSNNQVIIPDIIDLNTANQVSVTVSSIGTYRTVITG